MKATCFRSLAQLEKARSREEADVEICTADVDDEELGRGGGNGDDERV